MKWYRKEIVGNAFLVFGAAVPFEVLDGNRGVIALADDSPLIAPLDEAASAHRGGIVKISGEDYEDLKKNHPFSPYASRSPFDEKLRAMPTRQRAPFASRGPAVVEASPTESAAPALNLSPVVHPGGAVVNGEAQQAMASPPKFTPATRRISRKTAEGETAS